MTIHTIPNRMDFLLAQMLTNWGLETKEQIFYDVIE